MDLAALRQDYMRQSLRREDLAADPIDQFTRWIEQAQQAQAPEPNAAVLATVDAAGQPHTRTVLLKKLDARGFVFFTNLESTKAVHLAANPRASLLFLWLPLERQVTLTGIAEKIPASETLAYFLTRPLGSRLGAWTSQQSRVISSRSLLEQKWEQMKRKFADGDVPLPSFWGGYRVNPQTIEFWQGRRNRLHDRLRYRRDKDGSWTVERIAP
jgi:pyridoxamine 5'-phosphate oxidase